MKRKVLPLERKVLYCTLPAAVGIYLLDVFLDFLLFYPRDSFPAVFTEVSSQELVSRAQLAVVTILLGGLFSWGLRRLRLREKALLEKERKKRLSLVAEEIDPVNLLKGLLPICSSCKKIRDGKGRWTGIESYIHEHAPVEFSHSLCPECARRLYPELDFGGRQLTLNQDEKEF